eukprot:g738.t1
MFRLSGYAVEHRRAPEDQPNLPRLKYNRAAIKSWDDCVWTWGWGGEGRLGTGGRDQTNKPTRLHWALDKGIRQIALGERHSLFLCASGELHACGHGRQGQLAASLQESLVPRAIPRKVFRDKVEFVAAGASSSFAVTRSGLVYAWGSGKHGCLGTGSTENRKEPTIVPELCGGKVVHVEVSSYHGHALTSGGALYSWGLNRYGQLGLGDRDERHRPEIVHEFLFRQNARVLHVAASQCFTMAIVEVIVEPDVTADSEGGHESESEDERESLAEEGLPEEHFPEEHPSEENLPEENLPEENLPEDNLPEENLPEDNLPKENPSEDRVQTAPMARRRDTMQNIERPASEGAAPATRETRSLFWKPPPKPVEEPKPLQLKHYWKPKPPDPDAPPPPRRLPSRGRPRSRNATSRHSVTSEEEPEERSGERKTVRNADGLILERRVYCWGFGDIRLCLGEEQSEWYAEKTRSPHMRHQLLPTVCDALSDLEGGVVKISLGHEHGIVLTAQQRVYTFGRNQYCQLGTRDDKDRHEPFELFFLAGCLDVFASPRSSMALRETGELYTWGRANCGSLGHGDESIRSAPHLVLSFRGRRVQHIAFGAEHAAAITSRAPTVLEKPAKVRWKKQYRSVELWRTPCNILFDGSEVQPEVFPAFVQNDEEEEHVREELDAIVRVSIARPIFDYDTAATVEAHEKPPTFVRDSSRQVRRAFPVRQRDRACPVFSERQKWLFGSSWPSLSSIDELPAAQTREALAAWITTAASTAVPEPVAHAAGEILRVVDHIVSVRVRDNGWRQRRDAAFRERKRRRRAAIVVQAHLRRLFARLRYLIHLRRCSAALRLQCWARCVAARERTRKQRRFVAARRLQSRVRGKQARKRTRRLAEARAIAQEKERALKEIARKKEEKLIKKKQKEEEEKKKNKYL